MSISHHEKMASGGDDHDVDDELTRRANNLLSRLDDPIDTIDSLTVEHFVVLYNYVTGKSVPGYDCMRTVSDRSKACQFIVDSLAAELGLPFDHISGSGIVAGNRRMVADLLEILNSLVETEDENDTPSQTNPLDDLPTPLRNILMSLHEDVVFLAETAMAPKKHRDLIYKSKDVFTQTTPVLKTACTTSPVKWSCLLGRTVRPTVGKHKLMKQAKLASTTPLVARKTRNQSRSSMYSLPDCSEVQKGSSKKQIQTEISWAKGDEHMGSKPLRITDLGSSRMDKSKFKENVPKRQSQRPLKKVQKPKTVICSKLRRQSATGSVSSRPAKLTNPQCTAKSTDYYKNMMKLTEDLKSVRQSISSVNKQIVELQDQLKRFRNLENLIIKEIKLTRAMENRRQNIEIKTW